MALDGILASALTALQTNAQALRVVSNNVANMNTPGYVRRVVNESPLDIGGQLAGVSIADVQRVTDQFLMQEVLSSNSSSSQYSTQSSVFDQINGILGQPGDGTALTSQLDDAFSALGQASLSPNSSASQLSVIGGFQNFASTISSLSTQIANVKAQVDQQVSGSVSTINSLLTQIYALNQQVQTATAGGDTSSGLLDQRDQLIQQLSQYMDVRTSPQSNGQLTVMTTDGMTLVGDTYAQLSYSSSASSGSYNSIQLNSINPQTGAPISAGQPLDAHLSSGSLRGLLDMRDNQIPAFEQELGNFARQTQLAFNSVNNANAAFPPPSSLNGRDTGLLSTDGLNFTGKTTIAVADSSGNMVSRVDVDFDAGTLSVDGGAAVSIGSDIGSFVTALNGALGGNGTASFQDGKLSISATGSNGIVVQDDATTPSSRAGTGFSQFFGLNDLFQSDAPSILSTGLTSADASGFAAGGSMSFTLKGPKGDVAKQASVTLTAGMTIGDVVNALNTSFGGAATFSLGSDGSLKMTPASAYSGYTLNVNADSTARGTTGMSFTELFGLGSQASTAIAQSFSVNPAIVASPQLLAFAQPSITSSSVAGDPIVASGDTRGLLALQAISNGQQNFGAAGNLGAQATTLGSYAANWYQDIATQGAAASASNTEQGDRLQEAQTRQSQTSGVNLDEELSNMMIYQQAYGAGARILQTVQQMYDTLLQISG
ncbi:MAG TPA: flagellar hook-associated protein FlgK [Rhizomicrobium sp.]|nr:flagellar hook-associated protein FlgK [Rhizomicrobium sp.]